jgi:transcriptional regulator of nitric oxide reductase
VKRLLFALAVTAGTLVVVEGQAIDAITQRQLKYIFPKATSFSPHGGDPPHFKVFVGDPKLPQSLVGYAFWTDELLPNERGYDGPIPILVGMDTKGVLVHIIVDTNHEPYGSFSVDTSDFAYQFKGKDIRDPFKVGDDVDKVARATISVTSAARAIRNSARRVANQFLTPPGSSR